MSPTSFALLGAFWSWVSGVGAALLLGLLLPVTAALEVALLGLALKRHDWREPLQLLLPIVIFAAFGLWLLTRVHEPAPTWDFWLVLSVQLGSVAFVAALAEFLRLTWKRLRRDREALEAVRRPVEAGDDRALRVEPGPRQRLGAIEAEYYIAEWIRFLGATEAVVTPPRRDGGVDVRSQYYVAQVKHRPTDFVSVEAVRALVGVAAVERRTPLFFSSGRYSRDCYAIAADAGAALFIFRPAEGRLVAANAIAQRLRGSGLLGASEVSFGASSGA